MGRFLDWKCFFVFAFLQSFSASESGSTGLRMTAFNMAHMFKTFGWLHLEPPELWEASMAETGFEVEVESGRVVVVCVCWTCYAPVGHPLSPVSQIKSLGALVSPPQRCRPHVTVVENRPRRLATNPVGETSETPNSSLRSWLLSGNHPTNGIRWCGTGMGGGVVCCCVHCVLCVMCCVVCCGDVWWTMCM